MTRKRYAKISQIIADIKNHSVGAGRLYIIKNGVSAMDIVRACVGALNKPSLDLWTWAIGPDEAAELHNMAATKTISGLQIVADTSLRKRSPGVCKGLLKATENIRLTNSHCKIYLIHTPSKQFTITSSANLNRNRRFEFYQVDTTKDRFQQAQEAFKVAYEQGQKI